MIIPHRVWLCPLLALGFVSTLNGAVTLAAVGDGSGYDETNVPSFRSTNVAKGFDADGDNIYGTEGLFFFGNGSAAPNGNGNPFSTHTDLGPAWVTAFAQGADFASVAESAAYGAIDTPTLSGVDVADWEIHSAIAVATGGVAGDWLELMTFTIDAGAPSHFRVGVMAGNEANSDGRWDATGFRLSVAGESSAEVTALPNNGNGNPSWVFFDVTITAGATRTFSIEGQKRLSAQGPSIAGITFDVHPDAVRPTIPKIEFFAAAHTPTEGQGKLAWSVTDATAVSILDSADQPVPGVSGLVGTVDLSYIPGASYTLVATNADGERTETRSFSAISPLEDVVTFKFETVTGVGNTGGGVNRRDPSDVIKVGDTWHVWYSRMTGGVTTGYDATVWHATSTNGGSDWVEQGEAVARGAVGEFDETSVFTPNILFHDGTYFLYYTGIWDSNGDGSIADEETAIGVATSSSPYGPWTKHAGNPVLEVSADPAKFDSFRIDDTCMALRGGKVWFYYKGRGVGLTSSQTKMGVAVGDTALGPFVRQNGGDPVQLGGHEVQVWVDAHEGVYSLVGGVGPASLTHTIQYAADGINFQFHADVSTSGPAAPGLYRRELTNPSAGGRPEWGVDMRSGSGTRYLGRYEINLPSSEVTFGFDAVSGVGPESGVYRRDPSDIIKVGDTWHVWYSKPEGAANGPATVWHATSTNAGMDWVEEGMAIPRGTDSWDSDSAFTPNILLHEGTYYLYYTGVGPNYGTTSGYVEDQKFRIGVATSASPYGPWTKSAGNPILIPSTNTSKFDSFRVDDSCLAVRGGKIWLYHKGRQWNNTPANTKMGVVIADDPLGPFVRQNGGNPVQPGGHEVQIWMDVYQGVYSMVGSVGPSGLTHTIQYAADGMNFQFYADISTSDPSAPAMARTELTDPSAGGMPNWGMYGTSSLARFAVAYNDSVSPRIQLDPGSIVEGNRMGDFVGALGLGGSTGYAFELLPILDAGKFLIDGALVSANSVFDTSLATQRGLMVRATSANATVDAYFDVAVLEASGIRKWRLAQFGAGVLAQPELESTVWGDAANPDGDAFANQYEFAADTLPLDAGSALRIESIVFDGSAVEISWVGGEQATQYLESSPTLEEDDWTIEATYLPPTAVSKVWGGTVDPAADRLFYRVRAAR